MTRRNRDTPNRRERLRHILVRGLPAWVLLCLLAVAFAPNLPDLVAQLIRAGSYIRGEIPAASADLAPFFTAEVDHWRDDILRWATTYRLDPNLVATVIQIESCGNPRISSTAGAQGLMQVMPSHFAAGEDPLDPDTNAGRGLGVLQECLNSPYNAAQDVGLAFACYNGGPSVFVTAMANWHPQARDYYIWSTGIYQDVLDGRDTSATLERWLLAGGERLCEGARRELGLSPAP